MIDGLSIGASGLLAAQRALDVAAHNLANVNTPGYVRQRVLLGEAPPTTGYRPGRGPGVYGSGVQVQGIQLMQDQLVEQAVRSQLAELGAYEVQADLAGRVDQVLGVIEGGLADDVDAFFSAWDKLSLAPDSLAARNGVLQAGQKLAGSIRNARGILAQVQTEARASLDAQVAEINSLSEQVAALNGRIMEIEASGGNAGDLQNQRGRLLDRLAKLAGAQPRATGTGAVDVLVPGGMLVGGTSASPLQVTGDPPQVTWASNGLDARVAGAAGATRDAIGVGLEDLGGRLDLLANGLRDAVNAVHTAGFDLDGAAGIDFFTGTGAHDLDVNAALTARTVAASASGAASDGNQALALADLRNAAVVADPSDPATPVESASDAVGALLGEIGRRAAAAAAAKESATLVSDQLAARRSEVSGVSADEELTDLLRFQRAYEASARVVTVMDEVLDVLVNRLGVVGR